MRDFRARRDRGGQRLLRVAVDRASKFTARTDGSPVEVQLLGQVSESKDWPHILSYWTRRTGLTGSWPQRLRPDELVLNLWPISPGTVGLTTGIGAKPEKRQPRKLLSTPSLLSFDPTQRHVNSEGALTQAIASWVDDVVIAHSEYPNGLLLAPPILEEWAPKGQLRRRTILTFDLDWQLPSAENVTWPAP
jgi:hypothetical protein